MIYKTRYDECIWYELRRFVVLQRQAVTRIEDLKQKHIDLELMHMDPSDRPFDVNAFYKVFIQFSLINVSL